MRREYQILWIDDQTELLHGYRESVQAHLNLKGFDLKVREVSKVSEKVISEIEDDLKRLNPYNLILVDHNLADGQKGASFAKRLRDVIYTDIVYYSDTDITELRAKLFEEEVDGVYISNRTSLHDDVKNIIDDQIKRDFDAINMRGFMLDALSQMEGLLRDKYAEFFQSLSADEREQKIQEMIHAIGARQEKSQERIKKLRANGDVSGMLNCTSLVTLDVVRDALKGLVPDGERILGSKSEFHKLQEGRNRWAHDSISLDKSGQRVILSNDKSHKEGYGREEFEKMRVLLGSVGAELEACVSGVAFNAKK
jgi:hypothetical protein